MCEGRRWISQLKQNKNSPFFPLSVLFRHSVDWMMPTPLLRVNFSVSLLIQMLISSRAALTDIPKKNVLLAIWVPPNLAKLTHKINHLRVTGKPRSTVTLINVFFLEMAFRMHLNSAPGVVHGHLLLSSI